MTYRQPGGGGQLVPIQTTLATRAGEVRRQVHRGEVAHRGVVAVLWQADFGA